MLFSFNFGKMLKMFFNSPDCVFVIFVVLMVTTVSLETHKIDKARTIYERKLKMCNAFDNHRCENGGLLEYSDSKGFTCACTQDYIGEICDKAKPVTLISLILSWIRHSFLAWDMPVNWWRIIPFTSGRQLATVYAFHQNVLKSLKVPFYDIGNEANELDVNGRLLPRSRPIICPNNKNLPPLDKLYTEIFERKSDQFKPDLKNRNLLFNAFYQYFIMQFFDSNSNFTVTASQLYGSDAASEKSMRSFSGGKIKTLYYNNEHYAPYTLPIISSNIYLKEFLKPTFFSMDSVSTMPFPFNKMWKPKLSSSSPMLFAVSTLWVREHNRVCDLLSLMKSPKWTDEQIYNTARNIVTGEMMKIMMNEILSTHTGHAYPLNLRPEVYHHELQKISGSTTPIEIILMMSISSLPEQFNGNPISSMFYGDSRQVLSVGLKNTVQFMIGQTMGRVTVHNDGPTTKPLTEVLMKLSREHSVQSFNNYRRRFGLPAYDSFYQLTKNQRTAEELNNLYTSVEDVELLTGILTEGSRIGSLPTATIMTQSFIVNAILTNKLTSEGLWKSDTFGGDQMFNLVKSTTLKSLVCRNLVDHCDGLNVGLHAK